MATRQRKRILLGTFLTRHLVIAIPLAMLAGLFYGNVFDPLWLKGMIVPLTVLMVYPMMVNLNAQKLFNLQHLRVQFVAQLVNFALIPFVAFGIGKMFFADQPYYILGFLLAGLLPTSGMTISWTGFAKGNIEVAVKMTVVGLTAGSLLAPLFIKALLGAQIDVNMMDIARQIGLIVFLPMILGQMTRGYLLKRNTAEHFKSDVVPLLSASSTLGVLGVVFVAMALKASSIWTHPQGILVLLVPTMILYGLNYAISTWVGQKYFSRAEGIALIYGTVMRNLSIALAIAMNSFGAQGADAALVICFAYIVQVQSAAWYVKFTDAIFGKTEGERCQA